MKFTSSVLFLLASAAVSTATETVEDVGDFEHRRGGMDFAPDYGQENTNLNHNGPLPGPCHDTEIAYNTAVHGLLEFDTKTIKEYLCNNISRQEIVDFITNLDISTMDECETMIYGPFDAMKFEILEMLKDEDTCRAEVEEELSTIPQGRKLGQIMAPLIGAGSYIVGAGTGVTALGDEDVSAPSNNGDSFDAPTKWLGRLGYNSGWRVDKHPRFLSDVNGDGLPDVVGFGDDGVMVALNNGDSFDKQWLES
uniref:Uncharacterized protein n=1 Tax=Ditylum brightwellii TaxID=49249 RepID=A0A7S4RQ14_9STRA